MVREYSALRFVVFYWVWVPPQSPTCGGGGVIIPLWVVEGSPGDPELFWVALELSRRIWMSLERFVSVHSFSHSHLFAEPLVPVPQTFTMCMCSMVDPHIYLGVFCQVRWSADTQIFGESCTAFTKDTT